MKETDQTISYAIWNMVVCMRDLMDKPKDSVLREMICMEAYVDLDNFVQFISARKSND